MRQHAWVSTPAAPRRKEKLRRTVQPFPARALFVFDRENRCSVFPGPEQAAVELVVNDVSADEYVAFDEHGTVFRLWAEEQDVRLSATDDRDEEQLRERLAAFVTKWQIEVPSSDLIEIGNAILREDWNSRWPKRPRWLASRLHGNTPPSL
jgi:hypothetical protein